MSARSHRERKQTGNRVHDAYPGHTDENGALERGFAHESSLVHCLRQATARRGIIGVGPCREFVEITDAGGHIRGEQRARLQSATGSMISGVNQVCVSVLTVSVSHPVSAFLVLASSNVDRRTALSLDTGVAGGRFGFLRVSRCLTTGGRCLTTMAKGSICVVQEDEPGMCDDKSPWANARCGGIAQEIGICEIHRGMTSEPGCWETNRFCTRDTLSHTTADTF